MGGWVIWGTIITHKVLVMVPQQIATVMTDSIASDLISPLMG